MDRAVLESLGGWDENALTEDADPSIRIYQAGYRIKYIPYAITWEQEPERLPTWFRQRVLWVRGNNYVAVKHARRLLLGSQANRFCLSSVDTLFSR